MINKILDILLLGVSIPVTLSTLRLTIDFPDSGLFALLFSLSLIHLIYFITQFIKIIK